MSFIPVIKAELLASLLIILQKSL